MGVAYFQGIKPENFLLMQKSDNAKIKMIDFGLAKKLDNPSIAMNKIAGSPFYIAPEVLDGNYTMTCDVWSMGIILYVMM